MVQGLLWRNPKQKSIHRYGFLIEESLNPRFKIISDRISTAKLQLNDDHYATIIVAYAPILRKRD